MDAVREDGIVESACRTSVYGLDIVCTLSEHGAVHLMPDFSADREIDKEEFDKEGERERMKKHIRNIILAGIVMAILVFILDAFLEVKTEVIFFIVAITIILESVLFNAAYNLLYSKKVSEYMPLFNNGEYEKYIEEMKKLKEKAKGEVLKSILNLNIAAGYLQLKQYQEALSLLENISTKKLAGKQLQLVYSINLCSALIGTGNTRQAMNLFEQKRSLFEKFRNNANYSKSIEELYLDIEKLTT